MSSNTEYLDDPPHMLFSNEGSTKDLNFDEYGHSHFNIDFFDTGNKLLHSISW